MQSASAHQGVKPSCQYWAHQQIFKYWISFVQMKLHWSVSISLPPSKRKGPPPTCFSAWNCFARFFGHPGWWAGWLALCLFNPQALYAHYAFITQHFGMYQIWWLGFFCYQHMVELDLYYVYCHLKFFIERFLWCFLPCKKVSLPPVWEYFVPQGSWLMFFPPRQDRLCDCVGGRW